jgi:hypothetical protein
MKVRLKFPARVGSKILPKGTEGYAKGISNSPRIRETFPNLSERSDGYLYIVKFPDVEDCLFDKSQLEIL